MRGADRVFQVDWPLQAQAGAENNETIGLERGFIMLVN